MSKLLPAFPHGLQRAWMTGPSWMAKDEWIESQLKPQSLSLHRKALCLGENSILSSAWAQYALTTALWVALRHTSGFCELEQSLEVKVVFRSDFQLSIFATNTAVQWWEVVLFVTRWQYSCFMGSITGAKVYGRCVPIAHLASSAVRLGNSLIFIIKVFSGLTNYQVKSYSSWRKSY